MPLTLACPTCGKRFQVPDSAAGKQGRCPGCKHLLQIPGTPAPPEGPEVPETPEAGSSGTPAPGREAGQRETKACPYCSEEILATARKCRHCGEFLDRTLRHGARAGRRRRPLRPVPNHLVSAILVTLFCCVPGGIVAIIYAAQSQSKLAAGNEAGARQAARNASTWIWVSALLGGLGSAAYFASQM
jgi:hypothetical protein